MAASRARGSKRRRRRRGAPRAHPCGLQRKPLPVGAGDEQKILREPHEPIGLVRSRPERSLELVRRARPARRQLELGLEERERRAELVTRVSNERPLALEGRSESIEHLVQRLAEPVDLVSRGRQRQAALGLGGRDRLRLRAHGFDRPQRGAGDEVADDRRRDERERKRDDKLCQQRGQCLVTILEELADDDDVIVDRVGAQPKSSAFDRQ